MEQWTKKDLLNAIEKKQSEIIYFHTPICGTCQVAERMLHVVQELVTTPFRKVDLNYMPEVAERLSIESVPCLLIMRHGEVAKKVYAFQSVPHIHQILLEEST